MFLFARLRFLLVLSSSTSDQRIRQDPTVASNKQIIKTEQIVTSNQTSLYEYITLVHTITMSLEEIKADIVALVKEKSCAPILIRLSWHDA